MKIDLHTHSTASDGSLSPAELVRKAAALNIDVLALTDHDTIDGLEEFILEGAGQGVKTLTGVELSVDYPGGSLHLLGYGFNADNTDLSIILNDLKQSRTGRNAKILRKLRELGYRIELEGVLRHARAGVVGRPHIAVELVQSGQCESIETAFESLLKRGGVAYFDRQRLSLFEACELIHNAGGVAVWAHPGLHGDQLDGMIYQLPQWQAGGLDGIETDYSAHSVTLRDDLRKIAGKLNLVTTGGSDFHGSYRPGVQLGDGSGGSPVAERCYTQLYERLRAGKLKEINADS